MENESIGLMVIIFLVGCVAGMFLAQYLIEDQARFTEPTMNRVCQQLYGSNYWYDEKGSNVDTLRCTSIKTIQETRKN